MHKSNLKTTKKSSPSHKKFKSVQKKKPLFVKKARFSTKLPYSQEEKDERRYASQWALQEEEFDGLSDGEKEITKKFYKDTFSTSETSQTIDRAVGHPTKFPKVVTQTYHTNHYGEDKFYNPDEDSDFEPHYDLPADGVAAFPFATTPYKFSIRFAQDPAKVHNLDIYEGETYFDAVYRHKLIFPDVKCNLSSTFQQEEQFFHGATGCGGCIAQFPVGFKAKLPDLSKGETTTMRNFWRERVHHKNTERDGGSADSIRMLCTLNFTPDMDGVEIYALGTNHPHFDDNLDLIRASEAAMI